MEKSGGNTYPGKRKLLCLILKKESQKLKPCQKLLGILDEQDPSSVQSAEQVWRWGNVKHGEWLSQHLDLYLNINKGFHAKESQAIISESM